MGKNKPNAYGLFVRESFNRMRKNGENPDYNTLFARLNEPWKSLSEVEREMYKEKAKNGDAGLPLRLLPAVESLEFNTKSFPRNQNGQGQGLAPNVHVIRPPGQDDRPSTSNGQPSMGHPDRAQAKVNGSPSKVPLEIKPNVDSKPVIKEERGLKRELELDVINEEQSDRQEGHHEQPNKKTKVNQGFAVPNWRNIKNSTQPDADRYFDYQLYVLRNRCNSIVETHINDLITFPLYTFSCNVLCKYKICEKVRYVPIEIAISAYTIKDGQTQKPFHALIDAGPCPMNYWNDSKDHMENTHKIKITQDGQYPPKATNQYRKIYKAMLKYTKSGERTILVADNYDLEQVKSCIEWLYEKSADPDLPKISSWAILPLVDYIAAAYNHIYCHMLHYPLPKFTLHYFLKVRLETSLWDYDTDLMCDYHKQDENQTKWCARSCAIRAIRALELSLDQMYKYYVLAQEKANKRNEEKEKQAEPTPQAFNANGPCRMNPKNKLGTPWQNPQQVQQPLHMPEDTAPPPLIEEQAKLAELQRQQEEEFKKQFPPTPYYVGYYEVPTSPSQLPVVTTDPASEPPLAIKQSTAKPNPLDPRNKRQEPA